MKLFFYYVYSYHISICFHLFNLQITLFYESDPRSVSMFFVHTMVAIDQSESDSRSISLNYSPFSSHLSSKSKWIRLAVHFTQFCLHQDWTHFIERSKWILLSVHFTRHISNPFTKSQFISSLPKWIRLSVHFTSAFDYYSLEHYYNITIHETIASSNTMVKTQKKKLVCYSFWPFNILKIIAWMSF